MHAKLSQAGQCLPSSLLQQPLVNGRRVMVAEGVHHFISPPRFPLEHPLDMYILLMSNSATEELDSSDTIMMTDMAIRMERLSINSKSSVHYKKSIQKCFGVLYIVSNVHLNEVLSLRSLDFYNKHVISQLFVEVYFNKQELPVKSYYKPMIQRQLPSGWQLLENTINLHLRKCDLIALTLISNCILHDIGFSLLATSAVRMETKLINPTDTKIVNYIKHRNLEGKTTQSEKDSEKMTCEISNLHWVSVADYELNHLLKRLGVSTCEQKREIIWVGTKY